MKKFFLVVAAVLLSANVGSYAEVSQNQIIAGAGPSTAIVQLFVEEFSKLPETTGYHFTVPPRSSKHAGGIKCSDQNLFGRTGRPLNDKERRLNKVSIPLARIPIVFATGPGAGISSLTLKQLEGIITGKIKNWSQVGGNFADIIVYGREEKEALFSVLKKEYPFFRHAVFFRTFKKDDYVVNVLKNEKGKYAIGFGAGPNFRGLNTLKIKDFSSGVSVGLVYDLKNSGHPIVKKAVEYSKSSEWAQKIKTLNVMSPY